jgi:crossover junction endodeoxyribonuclease RuvC
MANVAARDRLSDTPRRFIAEGKSPRSKRVLGIDPGLDRTGYAVLESSPWRVLDAGLIRSGVRLPLAQRLTEIGEGLTDILAEHDVDLVAVEELYAHYKHPRTAILMGHARGVILLTAARRGLDVVSLPATMIKKSLTGNGHASKIQMQRAIMATLGLRKLPEPADVADALAAAFCALHIRREV